MGTQQSSRTARSLADDLRGRGPGQVRHLLDLRPDLLDPWPADLSQLARRAADDASVLSTLGALNTASLRVLEVYAALHEATADQVSTALGEPVDAVVADLWDRALLWGGPVFKIVRAAQQAFGAYPCGLSAASHLTPDPDAIRAAAADMDPDRLRYLVWQHPVSTVANPLTVIRGEQNVVPREVALVLRDGLFLAPASPPQVGQLPAAPVAATPWNVLAGVRYLLTDLAVAPLACNPARGVSRRALDERSAAMAAPVEEVLVWLELAATAGLVGVLEGQVHSSAEAARWLQSTPQQMWEELIAAWLLSDRPLPRCRPDDLGCVTTNSIARAAAHRQRLLQVWPAVRVTAEELQQVLQWELPRLHDAQRLAEDVQAELSMLGLMPGGFPADGLRAAAQVAVPACDNALIVQPDHTIIAGANVDHRTWALLHEIARVESWGPVVMMRIEGTLLRSAVARHGAGHILAELGRISRTPIPQSVEYLVRDAARSAPAQMARVTLVRANGEESQTLRDLGWQELAPDAFITELGIDAVRSHLGKRGVATTSVQQPVHAAPLDHRRPAQHDPDAVDRLVVHLVQPAVEAGMPPVLTPTDPARLRELLGDGRVWVEFSDGQQTLTHLVEPLEVRSGSLSAWSLTAARTLTIALSRIVAVRSADD